jgi:ELWxxDGT repeat protein
MVLFACNTPVAPPTADPNTLFDGSLASVGLSVVAVNASAGFTAVGQVINYSYTVTNTGSTPLMGPVTITDDKTTVPVCPALTTVGNGNNNLDTGESVNCTSTYTIIQNDITAAQVTSNAVARVGGVDSNRVTTTIRSVQPQAALTVSCTANPTTYTAAGQTINFQYTVKNSGAVAIGPTQFTVRDSLISAPINCDVANRTLGPNETITCSGTYTTTQNDLALAQIANSVTTTGGTTTSPAGSCPVTKSGVPITVTPPPSGNFTKGSTIQHTVRKGEWLLQIARCYGIQDTNVAAFREILRVNPQIYFPNFIKPDLIVTIPNIGADGPIFGPPCIGYHVVQSGDTWDTIKTKYNAKLDVLQEANRTVTFGNGVCLRIPLNSALGSTGAQPALTACPGTTPPTTGRDPIRLSIAAGQTTTTVTNSVDSTSKVRFLLAATQGQTLSVKVTAAANEVSMGVFAANGTALKAQDTTLTFTGTIPVTGDTAIDVASVTGTTSKSFTLEVTVTTPTTGSPSERAADINTGINNSDPAYLTVFNGQLFFKATGADNAGAELWKYDPATKTPSRVTDKVPGAGSFDPAYLATFNNALYFRANGNDNAGTELWRWNGSDAGRLTDINPGAADASPAYLTVFNNMLYFSAKGGDNAGVELWRTDGTTATRAADINTAGDSNPSYLAVFNNALYFSAASTDGAGVELWKYDGTNAPTRVADINPGVGNSNPAHLAVFNNALYFSANANDGKGVELWKYDGTNPPAAVADINAGAGDSAPSYLAVFNNALYFSANGNDGAGTELWKYDGSTTPKRVSDINTAGNSNPSYLVVFNNELYFQANSNDGTGTELWKFKGP